ncbi:hypothetical protein TELCIR_12884 [Teladorsagia circumcincta]|uniref:Uncharacterized protein n=1 Tax=Teladorsagia circumcincta TaxID=45464 RepID=A0A2G9U595_TELCI|nr:hypothetical protein TELCIR_12884 [Teladorsagia circumcincta]
MPNLHSIQLTKQTNQNSLEEAVKKQLIQAKNRAGDLLKADEKEDEPGVNSHLESLQAVLVQLRDEENAYDEHIKWLQQRCLLGTNTIGSKLMCGKTTSRVLEVGDESVPVFEEDDDDVQGSSRRRRIEEVKGDRIVSGSTLVQIQPPPNHEDYQFRVKNYSSAFDLFVDEI